VASAMEHFKPITITIGLGNWAWYGLVFVGRTNTLSLAASNYE